MAASEAPTKKRNGFPIHAWLPDDIGKQLTEYIESQEAPPTVTAVVILAMKEFLAKRGFRQPRSG